MGTRNAIKKELKVLPRKERKALKKELKEKKFSDPYGIDEMPDEEFLKVSNSLLRKARFRSIWGILLVVLAIVALVLSWRYV